jgi:hypothetical protein
MSIIHGIFYHIKLVISFFLLASPWSSFTVGGRILYSERMTLHVDYAVRAMIVDTGTCSLYVLYQDVHFNHSF